MLPKFNYIVAQAGADALLPAPLSHHSNGSAIPNYQQASPLPYPREPSSPTTRDRPYYRSSSPSPRQLPALPQPMPYMYSSDYNQRPSYYAPPPPLNMDRTSSSFRPLTPNKQTWRDDHSSYYQPPPPAASTASASALQHQQSVVLPTPTPPPPQPPSQMAQPPPPPPPPPAQPSAPQSSAVPAPGSSSVWHAPAPSASFRRASFDYDPYHSQYDAQWDQDSTDELDQGRTMRKLRECNDLLTTMNNEFWEHSATIYRNKLQALQEELRSIQEGTHEAFVESLADFEQERKDTVERAQLMLTRQLAGLKRRFDSDISTVDQDYENERLSLHDTIISAIEDRRKLIREDRDNGFDVKELFQDAYSRVNSQRRNLRKRPHLDRGQNGASPSRHETSRRRQTRPGNTSNGVGSGGSSREEDDLEQELILMKKLIAASKNTP
ncbi:hypothetical protein VTP01DRAFT_9456 [Rhizomucor pusillus]|uniref:uncharacterized protein n=1 Tax=Rhizomucor pusillus TaxID=4840 RepID=UPI00374461F3